MQGQGLHSNHRKSHENDATEDIQNNCFLVIPFRPPSAWYAARVEDIDVALKKVKLDWLYSMNNVKFIHKQPGDKGYERLSSK